MMSGSGGLVKIAEHGAGRDDLETGFFTALEGQCASPLVGLVSLFIHQPGVPHNLSKHGETLLQERDYTPTRVTKLGPSADRVSHDHWPSYAWVLMNAWF